MHFRHGHLFSACNDSELDYFTVADALGANREMARGVIKWYLQEGRVEELTRGGRNNIKIDDEMRQRVEAIINENLVLTLEVTNETLRERLLEKPQIHIPEHLEICLMAYRYPKAY